MVVGRGTAIRLIGSHIFFHEAQAKPSFFGETILAVERIAEGEGAGRFIFTFRFDPKCRDVKTPREGWSQEMKIVTP